jgi:hypothetical protein
MLIQDQRPLPAGDDVHVSITVADPGGQTLGQLDEQRGVPDGRTECTCAVLIYRWSTDGHLSRFGAATNPSSR